MDWSNYEGVEVVPGKVGGVPLLKGTRMPADQVIKSLGAGESVDEIAYNHDLNPSGIERLKVFRDAHQPSAKKTSCDRTPGPSRR